MKKILVMGLPGSGKTTFSQNLRERLLMKNYTVIHYNADTVREMYEDWDFSLKGRLRQAKRMKHLADTAMTDFVISDFIAPTEEIRKLFNADYTIWMNTENSSRFEDTDKIFEEPSNPDYVVKVKDVSKTIPPVVNILLSK